MIAKPRIAVTGLPADAQEERMVRAEAMTRVINALQHIQTAQQHLKVATVALSAIDGGAEVWNACDRACITVEQLWKRLDALNQIRKYTLDRLHTQDFLDAKRAIANTKRLLAEEATE